MTQEDRWKGPLLWFSCGALMGFSLLSILSIGIVLFVAGLGLSTLLARRKWAGAPLALVGAAVPWAIFAAEGYLSPSCASGSSTIGPAGEEHFRCHLMHSSSEFVPFLAGSLAVIAVGVALFFHMRNRRAPGPSAPEETFR
ncbi:MAG: hypothetical protein H0W21_05300 [Actinobacteria bacterium]|nr:hypothetical protein [Actinomycetota bacterium]